MQTFLKVKTMIRVLLSLFVLLFFLPLISYSQTIELPLIHKDGYGPFPVGLGGISYWNDNESSNKGVPENWENIKFGGIGVIHHSIDFVCGKDTSGNLKMIIDANNNYDFSDDKVFSPMSTTRTTLFTMLNDSIVKENQIMVAYEEFLDNEVKIKVNAPIFICYLKERNMLLCNFPKHAVVKFKGEEFAICSNRFGGLSYEDISIIMLNDSLRQGKKANLQEHNLEEYIKIEGEIYKNKGVDIVKNVLVLEKVDTPEEQIFSTQVEFKSPLFKGENIVTKDSLSLEDFKGKYLYIDFWGLGCGPCIEELPHLEELYEKIDTSQFEFLGIVSGINEDAIKKIMDKHSVSWSHILSNKENNITKLYGVNSFPTTFLLDKEGRVIAKNLRSKELADKIKELTK